MQRQTAAPRQGLSRSEVELSRKKHGSNVFSKQKRQGFLRQFAASFGDPIIKILLAALALNVLEPDFVKFITAALLLVILVLSRDRKKKVKINA